MSAIIRSRAWQGYLGLAPFLRLSINGESLLPVAQSLLAEAGERPDDAPLWMNLATAMMCLGQREAGLAVQQQALMLQRVFELPHQVPAAVRVLMLMAPGDVAENIPLECLFETGDVALIHYWLTPGDPFAQPLPAHDVVLAALGEADASRPFLGPVGEALDRWPVPVVNHPRHIALTSRHAVSARLQGIPGLQVPSVVAVPRAVLEAAAVGQDSLPAGLGYPFIVRPVGSQAGCDLARVGCAADLQAYLHEVAESQFYLAPFVDYSGPDGLFRKCRVAMVDGRPYASHMGVSQDWMIHYLNAGMYEDAARRAEEAAFMAGFDDFACRHGPALAAIHERLGLDYFCIDCAELRDGRLLLFEADHVMVVHAMDPVDRFLYKQAPMRRLREAVRAMLLRRAGRAV